MAVTWRNLLLAFALCVAAVVVEGWFVARTIARDSFAKDAAILVEAPCSDVHVRVDEHTSQDHPSSYSPELVCTYHVDGERYVVDSGNSKLGFSRWKTKAAAVAQGNDYLQKSTPHAYYEPDDPSRAAMSRNYDPGADGSVMAMVVLAPAALAFVVLFVVRAIMFANARRRARLASDDFPSARVVHDDPDVG